MACIPPALSVNYRETNDGFYVTQNINFHTFNKNNGMFCHSPFANHFGKVPDTGTRVLDNTGPFLHSSIVSFLKTLALSKNVNITFSGSTRTPAMFLYSLILGRSIICDIKYKFATTFFFYFFFNR